MASSEDALAPEAAAAASSTTLSFDALQRARSQSSGALLGNLRRPIALTFEKLDAYVRKPSKAWFAGLRGIPDETPQVLFGIHGGAQPGEMLAVMGPSGARALPCPRGSARDAAI